MAIAFRNHFRDELDDNGRWLLRERESTGNDAEGDGA
jgi:hypothetical protein